MLQEFQKFCCGDQPHINLDQPQPTPEPAPENTPDGSIDCTKDDSSAGVGAGTLPEQDANLKLPATNDLLQELEWNHTLWNNSLSESGDFDIDQFIYKMGKDKTKEKERHHTIRRNKKERLTKLKMLETYLEKYHSNILEEFEKFCENSKIVTSTTLAEKPPLQDSVKFKDGSTTTIESLPEQRC